MEAYNIKGVDKVEIGGIRRCKKLVSNWGVLRSNDPADTSFDRVRKRRTRAGNGQPIENISRDVNAGGCWICTRGALLRCCRCSRQLLTHSTHYRIALVSTAIDDHSQRVRIDLFTRRWYIFKDNCQQDRQEKTRQFYSKKTHVTHRVIRHRLM